MYAYNTNMQALKKAAKRMNFILDADEDSDRDRIRFTIRRSPDAYEHGVHAKYDPIDGRRAGRSVCVHGHKRFFECLFEADPGAKVSTSRYGNITYTAANLEEEAEEYMDMPMGPSYNIYHQFRRRDACNCEGSQPKFGPAAK